MALGLMGGDFGFGQVGITFWSLAAAIPLMAQERSTSHSGARDTDRSRRVIPVSNLGRA